MVEATVDSDPVKEASTTKIGTLILEGRIRSRVPSGAPAVWLELEHRLTIALSKSFKSFQLLEDILADPEKALDTLGDIYQETTETLSTLKIVQSIGPKLNHRSISLSEHHLKVHIYQTYNDARSLEDIEELPQAEITPLPHARFEGLWDELMYDNDLKHNLVRMMGNITQLGKKGEGSINPLILLHGPPGTGKTTLGQSLAQKISIRFSGRYEETRLVEIKTASLLSKYFGQSAKQVEEIFTKIFKMCNDDEDQFVFVLIDEIESVASSRERTALQGEAQDSLRATNALLTGIDRLKDYRNVMVLCTSNFYDSLDAAFLDRCAVKKAIHPPTERAQYAILRGKIQRLIDTKVIRTNITLPVYDDARHDFRGNQVHTTGFKIFALLAHLRASLSEDTVSGRSIAQLPQTALLIFLDGGDCDLDEALSYIKKHITDQEHDRNVNNIAFQNDGQDGGDDGVEGDAHGVEIRGKKRKLTILMEEDCDEDVLKEIVGHLRRRKVRLERDTPETMNDSDE